MAILLGILLSVNLFLLFVLIVAHRILSKKIAKADRLLGELSMLSRLYKEQLSKRDVKAKRPKEMVFCLSMN